MKPIQGYRLNNLEDLSERLSNLMRFLNASRSCADGAQRKVGAARATVISARGSGGCRLRARYRTPSPKVFLQYVRLRSSSPF